MPRKPAGLKVVVRPDTGTLTIVGTVNGERIRRRAQSSRPELAREEAIAIELELIRSSWAGQRRRARTFAEAVLSYIEAAPRSDGDKARLDRIVVALGDRLTLDEIDQGTITQLRRTILRTDPSPATVLRGVIGPLRAVMLHAHRMGWCERPYFVVPKQPEGRTRYLLPDQAQRLIAAAAPHLKPLLLFLLATGARMSEAIELEWRDVDLVGARVIFWRTKSGKRRVARLPAVVIAALANLPDREGVVFRWGTTANNRGGKPKRITAYADRGRQEGGQIKRGWRGAVRRAGLDPALTPHDLRHTWASWHYAAHRDLLALKIDGGWSSVELVERYAHLLPGGSEEAIEAFWHGSDTVQRIRNNN